MPGLSGLDLQELMQEQGFDMPVIFISGLGDLGSGVRAMKGGAVDFLEKPVSDVVLIEAVKGALAQHRERRRVSADRAVLEARFETLTPREREVFGHIATGLLNKQVGAESGAAEKTVKVHRARVMQKMAAGSLAELVRMADRLGGPGQAKRYEAAIIPSREDPRAQRPSLAHPWRQAPPCHPTRAHLRTGADEGWQQPRLSVLSLFYRMPASLSFWPWQAGGFVLAHPQPLQ